MIEDARSIIFKRIDSALGPVAGNPAAEWERLPRSYVRTDSLSADQVQALFEHRLVDYGAGIIKCLAHELPQTIEKILTDRNAVKVVISLGFPQEWLLSKTRFVEDSGLSFEKLDAVSGVLTTASAAIAETGSIVLQHGPGQGRRALTLIPDYHLCIVNKDQIVQTVPAAFERLDPRRPTTFISGPSATADIEMTRIKGVHGPRFMDVILVNG